MTILTFTPCIDPSPSTGRKSNYKLLKSEFGDGYTQITRDGINHRRRQLTLSWDVLTDEQAWEIADFLDARGGDETFLYMPPRESVPVKWTCEDWDDTVNSDGTRKITATFQQSFSNVL